MHAFILFSHSYKYSNCRISFNRIHKFNSKIRQQKNLSNSSSLVEGFKS